METADVRDFAEEVDRVLAVPGPDPAVLERLFDDATTVVNALHGETTRLHREIDQAVDDRGPALDDLTRELRDCYRDLDLLRPRVRAITMVLEGLRTRKPAP